MPYIHPRLDSRTEWEISDLDVVWGIKMLWYIRIPLCELRAFHSTRLIGVCGFVLSFLFTCMGVNVLILLYRKF